jgi:hypothetical protein
VQYLGFALSEKSIALSSEKVMTVQNFPTPRYVKDVRPFWVQLQSTEGWNRNSLIAKPLTTLTLEDHVYMGSESARYFEEFEREALRHTLLSFSRL